MLDRYGFEPAREAPDLVCGMNHAFLTGSLQGLRAPAVQAVLAPSPGECCVELRSTAPTDETETH
ncbi:hypothetical protein [Streptomyces canus]|uniref:hypothetical protein n=1 Tax=Streptomyces canus TaxID=58343 RepID=UPI0003A4D340|nr:hypothetical protein [Streptomyces canus]